MFVLIWFIEGVKIAIYIAQNSGGIKGKATKYCLGIVKTYIYLSIFTTYVDINGERNIGSYSTARFQV